jgi:hypothetical protein
VLKLFPSSAVLSNDWSEFKPPLVHPLVRQKGGALTLVKADYLANMAAG